MYEVMHLLQGWCLELSEIFFWLRGYPNCGGSRVVGRDVGVMMG